MAEASNLLCKTDRKIEEISSEIGYANEGYFYKCFKQKYGESPEQLTEKSIKILIKDSKSFIFYMKGREEKRYNFYLRKVFGG